MTVRAAFAHQATACESLGSPFMGRLCRLFAARLSPSNTVAERLLAWPGDVTAAGQSVPLRMAGALHALVIDGLDVGLTAVYPPNDADDAAVWQAIETAMVTHEDRLLAWLDSPPQTNEVRRAAALLAVASPLAAKFGLPFVLSELGASAGLNLHFDRFGLAMGDRVYGQHDSLVMLRPDASGPLPAMAPIRVIDRAGVDLRPINPSLPEEALRLLAYLWPDQPDRAALTRAAIGYSQTVPDAGDAAAWLEARLSTPRIGACHLVYHTIAWQYFPPETQQRAEVALQAAGAKARADAPLAHLSMEADGQSGSAALSLRLWDDGANSGMWRKLGRIDYHGRFICFFDG